MRCGGSSATPRSTSSTSAPARASSPAPWSRWASRHRRRAAAGDALAARDAVPACRPQGGRRRGDPASDASFDVVVVAQAFHWFDHGPALREIARVLRPGGRIALVWNMRDEREPWVAQLSDAMVGRTGVRGRARQLRSRPAACSALSNRRRSGRMHSGSTGRCSASSCSREATAPLSRKRSADRCSRRSTMSSTVHQHGRGVIRALVPGRVLSRLPVIGAVRARDRPARDRGR